MMKRAGNLIAVFAVAYVGPVWCCGPDFMENYLVYDNYNGVLNMPGMSFDRDIFNILQMPSTPQKGNGDGQQQKMGAFTRTTEADCAEFRTAVKGRPDGDVLAEQYAALRLKMTDWAEAYAQKVLDAEERSYENPPQEKPVLTPFNLIEYETFLAKIPQEFSFYLRGAVAFYENDYDKAVAQFNAVLDLPAEQRKYRSTWAAFMLGKICAKKDPAQAVPQFEKMRGFVKDGCADVLNLAYESLGWQARAEGDMKNFLASIHHYAEYAKGQVDPYIIRTSLYWACSKAMSQPDTYPALVSDPLCRELITTYLSSQEPDSRNGITAWLTSLEHTESSGPVAGADRIAWLVYQTGDMSGAARWLAQSDPNSSFAKRVHAKLLLREGKLDEGEKILRELVQPNAVGLLPSELGTVLLAKNDYTGALDAYMHGGYWPDVAYVAERLLTVKELVSYIDTHLTNTDFQCSFGPECFEHLNNLLARRLARQGEWDQAAEYFAQNSSENNAGEKTLAILAEKARTVACGLKTAHDEKRSVQERAQAFYDTGAILHKFGMEIMGTELSPDFSLDDGYFDWFASDRMREITDGSLAITPDEAARFKASEAKPPKRFHYRYIAADMMWQCAKLLPDNDLLMARALYEGGKHIENRDPQSADKFYQALVRRNPKLAIAQEADRLRWFPREFTDAPAGKDGPKPEKKE